jgi:hypothetical protein
MTSDEFRDSIRAMFEPGGIAYGLPHFDDDWNRFFPDGTCASHELCNGCQPDGSCPFHPPDCNCCGDAGECNTFMTTLR